MISIPLGRHRETGSWKPCAWRPDEFLFVCPKCGTGQYLKKTGIGSYGVSSGTITCISNKCSFDHKVMLEDWGQE